MAATLLFVWNQGAVAEARAHGRDSVPAITGSIAIGLIIGVALGIAGLRPDDRDAAAGGVVQRCGRRYRRANRVGQFIETDGKAVHGVEPASPMVVGSLIAAIISSISFGFASVAFTKLRESCRSLEKFSVSNAKLFSWPTSSCTDHLPGLTSS